MHVHTGMHTHTHMHTRMHVHTGMHTHTACTPMHMQVCMQVYKHVHACTGTCNAYAHVCTPTLTPTATQYILTNLKKVLQHQRYHYLDCIWLNLAFHLLLEWAIYSPFAFSHFLLQRCYTIEYNYEAPKT